MNIFNNEAFPLTAQKSSYLTNWKQLDPNSKTFASDTYANIIGAEYRDYVDRFQPYENRVMDLQQSRELLDAQLSRITANVNAAYDNQLNSGQLQMQRYGIQQTGQERAKSARQDDTSRALSIAHARNNTRLADADQKMGLVTGASSARSVVRNDVSGI